MLGMLRDVDLEDSVRTMVDAEAGVECDIGAPKLGHRLWRPAQAKRWTWTVAPH